MQAWTGATDQVLSGLLLLVLWVQDKRDEPLNRRGEERDD
jgi:hypothetical protein